MEDEEGSGASPAPLTGADNFEPLLKDDDDIFDDFLEKETITAPTNKESDIFIDKLRERSSGNEEDKEESTDNKPKRKRLRTKRKRSEMEEKEKEEEEDEESSASQEKNSIDDAADPMDIDIYDDDDASEEKTEKVPSSKEKAKQALDEVRAKKKAKLDDEQANSSRLVSMLTFADDEFDDMVVDATQPSASKKESDAKGDKKGDGKTESTSKPTKRITHNGWPLLAGQTDELSVRCTFATREEWSAFTVKDKLAQETPSKAARDFSVIGQTHWGIFVPHNQNAPSASKRSGKAAAANGSDDDLELEDNSGDMDTEVRTLLNNEAGAAYRAFEQFANAAVNEKSLQTCPWFVLVGSEPLMLAITSPCFSTRVRLVAIDTSQVEFKHNPDAPVYYVYDVVDKFPLWSDDMHYSWQLRELSRVLVDTLYLQMEVLTNGRTVSEELGRVLVSITGFPIHSTPALKMLTPSAVHLNSFSARRDRLDVLTRHLIKSVKSTDIGTASTKGVPVVDVSDLKTAKLKRANYLFSHMEKPLSAWRLLANGVPIDAIVPLSTWDIHDAQAVRGRFALTKPLYVRALKDINRDELLALGSVMRLDPSWFADWYQRLDKPSPAESSPEADDDTRLAIYAIFCASAAWHDYSDLKQAYGSNYMFLFSHAQQKAWFESGQHLCSARQAAAHLLENTDAVLEAKRRQETATSVVRMMQVDDSVVLAKTKPLSPIDVGLLRAHIEKNIEKMNKLAAKFPREVFNGVMSRLPCLVHDGIVSTTPVLVESSVQARVNNMAHFIFEVCIRWKKKHLNGALTDPFDKLPPLWVQNAFVYGPLTHQDAADIYTQLAAAVEVMNTNTGNGPALTSSGGSPAAPKPKRKRCMVIRASDDPATVKIELSRNLSDIYLLAFDSFHIWPEQLLDTVLDTMTMKDRVSDTTHVVITVHGQSLPDMTSSGLLLNDLIGFAQRIQTRLKLESANNAKDNLVSLTSLQSNSRFNKYLKRGELTEMTYLLMLRQAQFQVNASQDTLQPSAGFQTLLLKYASDVPHNIITAPVLVLYALRQTEAAMWRIIKNILQSVTRKQVLVISYESLARRPSMTLGGRKMVVLCDLHYSGAGRPTVQHLNAAFERTQTALYVMPRIMELPPNSGNLAPMLSHRDASDLMEKVFYSNDEKSDRLATQTQRLSLLKNKLDAYCNRDKIASFFDS